MIKRKTQIHIRDFPPELHGLLQAGELYDSSCSPGARTLYCDAGYYIKTADRGELAPEAAFGKLFHALGLGVEVMEYLSRDRDYLVTRSAGGDDLTHFCHDPEGICRIMADGLRRLHSHNPVEIPMSGKFREYAAAADRDPENCAFHEYLLMDRFGIRTRQEAWAVIRENQGTLRSDVLIHGDACLPNIIAREGEFSSFIDLGLAGAGDRHIDLFWAVWSLQFNLKTDRYTELFLDLYGKEDVDLQRLRTVAALEVLG